MKLASDFNIMSRKQAFENNKKDVKIAQMKSEVHELRQRAKDFIELNDRFNSLQVKVDLLKSAQQQSYCQGQESLGNTMH